MDILWVDPEYGSDVAEGTLQHPFCTIKQAMTVARTRNNLTAIYVIMPDSYHFEMAKHQEAQPMGEGG